MVWRVNQGAWNRFMRYAIQHLTANDLGFGGLVLSRDSKRSKNTKGEENGAAS